MRSFVAVPLPGPLQARIFAAARELARDAAGVGIKWSRKVENLHITVKFLGPVGGGASWRRWAPSWATRSAALPAVPIALRGMGAFPSTRQANVVWAGVDDVEHGLAAVADVVEGVGERLGFASRTARRSPVT